MKEKTPNYIVTHGKELEEAVDLRKLINQLNSANEQLSVMRARLHLAEQILHSLIEVDDFRINEEELNQVQLDAHDYLGIEKQYL